MKQRKRFDMSRPFIQYGIGQLEELFKSATQNREVLLQLQNELRNRHVPRAAALLIKVRKVLKDVDAPAGTSMPTSGATEEQSVAKDRDPEVSPDLFSSASEAQSTTRDTQRTAPSSAEMSEQEAYALLGLPLSASWEAIESARRQIVQRASPARIHGKGPLERNWVVSQAKTANEACALILQLRARPLPQ